MTEVEKIKKLEQILQATVEAVRQLDLHAFEIELKFYNHYKIDDATPLAKAALELEDYSRRNPEGDTDNLNREFGYTGDGNWSIGFFVRKDQLPPFFEPEKPVVVADPQHLQTLTEIVEAQ